MRPPAALLHGQRARALLVTVAGVLVVGLVVLGLIVWSPGGSTSKASSSSTPGSESTPSSASAATSDAATATVTPSASPPVDAASAAATPGLDPAVAARDAEAALRTYLALADQAYQTADGLVSDQLAGVSVGFAKGEVESAAQELADAESHQTGGVRVAQLDLGAVDVASVTPSVTFTTCLDLTGVDILDVNGDSLRAGRPGVVPRSAHTYGVQLVEGTWRVASHEFPQDATC